MICEDLKEKYWKYFNEKVDKWIISKKNNKQIEEDIKKYKENFIRKYPYYKQYKNFNSFNNYIKMEWKKIIAQKIGLPTFEKWQKGELK
jgi:hypothetical protein